MHKYALYFANNSGRGMECSQGLSGGGDDDEHNGLDFMYICNIFMIQCDFFSSKWRHLTEFSRCVKKRSH